MPVMTFDNRELFFPIGVEGYLRGCRLTDGDEVLLRHVTPADLDQRWGATTHLQFVTDDERRAVFRRDVQRTARRLLSPRLGLVGLFGRIIDAFLRILVLLRPTTPNATATAAERKVRRLDLHATPVCYGRAVSAGDWLVLHYAYLYAMNDWRTGYRGMNDHEGDWEQAWIFCDPTDHTPQWIATSNHENEGNDQRRHWTDPELTVADGRPVLHAAAGSHALFFRSGDYVTRFDLPGLRWLAWLRQIGRRIVGVRIDEDLGAGPAVGIPFVDHARGDGRSIADFDLRPLDDATWCSSFRGLWGVDTGDPLQAERGPGGPKFDRRGEIRLSWADPLGFAGLHGTPPPSALRSGVNLDKIDRALADLDDQVRAHARLLPLANQTSGARHLPAQSHELSELLRQRCELQDLRAEVDAGAQSSRDIRDHLEQPARVLDDIADAKMLPALWAMLSIPLIMLAIGVALVVPRVSFVWTTIAAFCLVGVAEQLIRRQFQVAFRVCLLIGLVALVVLAIAQPLFSVLHFITGGLLIAGALALVMTNTAEWFRALRARSRART